MNKETIKDDDIKTFEEKVGLYQLYQGMPTSFASKHYKNITLKFHFKHTTAKKKTIKADISE